MNAYWERMQARPSYKDAGQHQHHLWSKTKANVIFLVFMAFFAAIIMGILMIFWKPLGISEQTWWIWALGVYAIVILFFFAFFGNKSRKVWNKHLAIEKKTGKDVFKK